MSFAPGVYLEEVPRARRAPLTTGVPAFIGVTGLSRVMRLDVWDEAMAPRLGGYARAAVRGFFGNGGQRCYLVPDQRRGGIAEAVAVVSAISEVDLVCAPELSASSLDPEAIAADQATLLQRVAGTGRLFAILDALPDPARIAVHASALAGALEGRPGASSGALYFPWITIEGACAGCGGTGLLRAARCTSCWGIGSGRVPPCGHLAGIYARTDRSVGVFGAPANTVVAGAVDVAARLSSQENGDLDAMGVNCVRAFPGRGIRVWGARTLSQDPAARYVNVRRLILTLGRWIEHAMTGLVFEPQGVLLWVRVQRQIDALLGDLFRRGAFTGDEPAQAYYVRCDAETNPPEVQAAGQVVAEVGVAPANPGEFIRISVVQGERGVSVSAAG